MRDLEDGSWLATLRRSTGAKSEPMPVRVVDYTIDDGRGNDTSYRLFTTLLNPAEASAVDLAAAYHQRWEIELILDELKTHQRGPRTVLRSKSPNLVQQEVWGHLCCHYAIRTLMATPQGTAGATPTASASSQPYASPDSQSPPEGAVPPDNVAATNHIWGIALRR